MTRLDTDSSDEVKKVDDESVREERGERLLALYEKINDGAPQGKSWLNICGIVSVIAIVAVGALSWFVVSSLGPASSAGIWVAYVILVLIAVFSSLVPWLSMRSYHEVTLAWIDAWKKTEIEEIRRLMRARDCRSFELMQEIKFAPKKGLFSTMCET